MPPSHLVEIEQRLLHDLILPHDRPAQRHRNFVAGRLQLFFGGEARQLVTLEHHGGVEEVVDAPQSEQQLLHAGRPVLKVVDRLGQRVAEIRISFRRTGGPRLHHVEPRLHGANLRMIRRAAKPVAQHGRQGFDIRVLWRNRNSVVVDRQVIKDQHRSVAGQRSVQRGRTFRGGRGRVLNYDAAGD